MYSRGVTTLTLGWHSWKCSLRVDEVIFPARNTELWVNPRPLFRLPWGNSDTCVHKGIRRSLLYLWQINEAQQMKWIFAKLPPSIVGVVRLRNNESWREIREKKKRMKTYFTWRERKQDIVAGRRKCYFGPKNKTPQFLNHTIERNHFQIILWQCSTCKLETELDRNPWKYGKPNKEKKNPEMLYSEWDQWCLTNRIAATAEKNRCCRAKGAIIRANWTLLITVTQTPRWEAERPWNYWQRSRQKTSRDTQPLSHYRIAWFSKLGKSSTSRFSGQQFSSEHNKRRILCRLRGAQPWSNH